MFFTDEQQNALASIKSFLESKDKVFILTGYAGTGKTTIIKEILKIALSSELSPLLLAPTGRAAKVLNERTSYFASTIHSAIFKLGKLEIKQVDDDISTTEIPLYFPLNEKKALEYSWLCIIDEASMISSKKSDSEDFTFGTGILLDDIMRFVALNNKSKVIFIGDSAQLPPVGDNISNALNINWFKDKGYDVSSSALKEVVRQDSNNYILVNSLKIRDLLSQKTDRHELQFITKDKEVESKDIYEIIDLYVENWCKEKNSCSIITYTNKSALFYNRMIRSKLYKTTDRLVIGDNLMVIHNNHIDDFHLFNGDYLSIVKICSEPELINLKLKNKLHKDSNHTEDVQVSLEFIDVEVQTDNGDVIKRKLLLNLLDSEESNLNPIQMRALYIHFLMRYKNLDRTSEEFSNAIKSDEYFNALRVKYGYAITGHKSQGGEWKVVFADYIGRIGLNDDCLRWIYTITTRAKETLYSSVFPNISLTDKLKFNPVINPIVKTPSNFYSQECIVPETPFHKFSDKFFLKAKYWAVQMLLSNTEYKIENITSTNWLELYKISGYKYAAYYDKNGMFKKFKSMDNEENEDILELINSSSKLNLIVNYIPENDLLSNLHAKVSTLCNELNIEITNVILENYKVRYCLETGPYCFGFIDFWYNAKGALTNAIASSSLGAEDYSMTQIIQKFK